MSELEDFRLKDFLLTLFATAAAQLPEQELAHGPEAVALFVVMAMASPQFWTEETKKGLVERLTPYARAYLEGTLRR